MSKDIRSVVKEYHTFYEVSPYYLLAREGHGSSVATTRRVHAGYDVDVYGVNARNEIAPPGPDPDYALGCRELEKVAEDVSNGRGDCCSVEVMSFPSTAVINTRDHARVEATIRIRIAHLGNLGEPAGLPEQSALEQLEKQLKALGIARR
jgi:hypothetical protein